MSNHLSGPDRPAWAVLFVCTANHCRSPMAEHLLRHELAIREVDWTVSSAGTQATSGQPMHPSAARILARRGLDSSAWTSRKIAPYMVDDSDLILTASEEHRGLIARMDPGALSKTFTLLQFARLVGAVPNAGLLPAATYGRDLLSEVNRVRGQVQPMPSSGRDLPDPMGQAFSKFRRCATTIERAVGQIMMGVPVRGWAWPAVAVAE